MLEISRQHGEWECVKREKEKKRHDDKEAERSEFSNSNVYILPSFNTFHFSVAFAEIDWYDYAIVQTIEFTTAEGHGVAARCEC